MKLVKILLAVLGGLSLLAVIVVVTFAVTFDPNHYKSELTALVKQKTGRTLTIDGALGLSFFPKLGVTIGRATLSEAASPGIFARIGEARVSLALLPVLTRQVVIDRVILSGLAADLVMHKDGHANFDDLMGGASSGKAAVDKAADKGKAAEASPVKLDIGGVEIGAENLGWHDERDGTRLRISALTLKTGRIAGDTPGKLSLSAHVAGTKPRLNATLDLSAGYRFNIETRALALSGMALKLAGDVPGAAGLSASLKGDIESDPVKDLLRLVNVELTATTKDGIDVKLAIPKLLLSPAQAAGDAASGTVKIKRPELSLDARIALSGLQANLAPGKSANRTVGFSSFSIEWSGKQGDNSLQGKFGPPLAVNLDARLVRLSKLGGELVVSGTAIPAKSIKVTLDGQLGVDWGKQTASGDLVAKLDDSTLQARFGIESFAPAAIRFDVGVDRLDVDRYLPPKPAGSGGAGSAAAPGAGGDKPIDLAGLKGLNLNGQLRIGQLTASGVKTEKLQVNVRAAGGRLDLNPLSASLYGGTLAGSAGVDANQNQFVLKQQLTGINVGPLLRDAASKDILEGRGNVVLDVQTGGQTVSTSEQTVSIIWPRRPWSTPQEGRAARTSTRCAL